MRIAFLGTCSGTEPMAGARHVSLAFQAGGGVYFFDAGEGCAYTAHLLSIDLLTVRAIFISHTHWDHVGGLAGILWVMGKLAGRSPEPPGRLAGRTVPVFLPELGVWEGVLKVLGHAKGGFGLGYEVEPRPYGDGEVFDDGHLRAEALHNTHLGRPGPGEPWLSYSFRIESGGKAVVYSGDTGGVEELAPLAGDGCELLLMETGHHREEDVCLFIRDADLRVGRVVFVHHGRAILGQAALIARDGMALEI